MMMASFGPSRRPNNLAEARQAFRVLRDADRRRSHYSAARITLTIWRAGQCLRYARGPACWVLRRLVLLADLVWTQLLMGAELPHEVWAGPGLKLEHGGRGVVLHPTTRVGDRVTMYHRVTVGVKDDRPAADIGNRVYIGTGAVLLGPITVADGTRVGANAVLTHDTDPDLSYAGSPARPVGRVRRHTM